MLFVRICQIFVSVFLSVLVLVGMETFLRETSFHGVMLDSLFNAPSEIKKPLHDVLLKGIREGAVKPLVRTVFSEKEVEQAFR